jgi:hypothetical protein
MFVEYGEESMLTLSARVVSNMNVVRENQAVGCFLNLENTCVLTSPSEVILNFRPIFAMRRRLRIWPYVPGILRRD